MIISAWPCILHLPSNPESLLRQPDRSMEARNVKWERMRIMLNSFHFLKFKKDAWICFFPKKLLLL